MRFLRYLMLLALPMLAACNLAASTQPTQQAQPNEQPPIMTPAAFNDAGWSAYVYNNTRGELTRVGLDGSASTYSLGLPEGTFANAYDMSFSADGNLLAFCQLVYQPESALATATVVIRDVAAQRNVNVIEFGTSAGKTCSLGRGAFNGERVAVAIMNYIPGDPAADTSQPQWQIYVANVTTGAIEHVISANEFTLQATASGGAPAMPVLKRFRGDEVVFSFLPAMPSDMAAMLAYVWNVSAGTVETIDYWGNFAVDGLETGEVVWVDYDENLPAAQLATKTPFNVLRVADGGEARTLYHGGGEWILSNARFIDGGRQVAVLMLPASNPEMPESNATATRWVALDRAGNVSEIYRGSNYGEVMAAPDGFVVLEQAYMNGDFRLGEYTLVYHMGEQVNVLWREQAADGSVWELAWTSPMTAAEGLAAFQTAAP